MKFLDSIKNIAGRSGLQFQKHSPEILMGIGAASFIGAIISACKATTRVEDVLELHRDRMVNAREAAKLIEEDITVINGDNPDINFDLKREKVIIYANTALEFSKLYAPTIASGALSLACFFKAYNIVNTRYLGAVAAYNAVSSAFNDYRARVRKELGEESDRHFRYGTEYSKIEHIETDENGKKKKTTEAIENIDGSSISEYARFFDQSCPEWDPNPLFNLKWLKANETAANDILNARGHIFLNEVYDMIGLPHTSEGAVVGWVKGNGDDFVDFGLYNPDNASARRFINGDEAVVLLDFNVDGIIFDKI